MRYFAALYRELGSSYSSYIRTACELEQSRARVICPAPFAVALRSSLGVLACCRVLMIGLGFDRTMEIVARRMQLVKALFSPYRALVPSKKLRFNGISMSADPL